MEENNKLIAEFLGQDSAPYEFPKFGYIRFDGQWRDSFYEDQLKFHKDWNWLMAVVDKIDNLKIPITNNPYLIGKNKEYQFYIDGKHIRIYEHGEVTKEIVDIRGSEYPTKIEAVYNACVEFIKNVKL